MGQFGCSREILGLLFLLSFLCVPVDWIVGAAAAVVGVDNGGIPRSGYHENFVQLVKSRGIGKVRLYDADSTMLRALGSRSYSRDSSSSIEVIAGVQIEEVFEIGRSLDSARSWVARNVIPFYPATNIVAIAVGSAMVPNGHARYVGLDEKVTVSLLPAMRNVRVALVERGLDMKIKVTAPQSIGVLSSFLPPSAAFNEKLLGGGTLTPLLDFLESTGSFLLLDLHAEDLENEGVNLIGNSGLHSSSTERDTSSSEQRYAILRNIVINALVPAFASVDHQGLGIVVTEPSSAQPGPAIGYDANFVSEIGGLSKLELLSKPEAVIGNDGLDALVHSSANGNGRFTMSGALSSRRLLLSAPAPTRTDVNTSRRKLANKSWCVAKSGQSTDALQSALDWACGAGGADCSAIQLGQSCYLPNNIQAHASYAFNSYYQKRNWAADSCNFNGLATVTSTDPSSASCLYSSNTDANGSPSTPTGTIVPSTSRAFPSLSWNRCYLILTSFVLAFLLKRTFWSSEF